MYLFRAWGSSTMVSITTKKTTITVYTLDYISFRYKLITIYYSYMAAIVILVEVGSNSSSSSSSLLL